MKIWSTRNGHMVFQVLAGHGNAYLVANGSRYLLVDTGVSRQWPHLLGALDALGLSDDSLSALILTHTHYDHVQNAARIKEKFKVPVWVHRSEAGYLPSGESPLPAGSLVITKWFTERMASLPVVRFPFSKLTGDEMVDDRKNLEDIGIQGYVLHTPGHSSGSLSVIVDEEIAIVGDTMWGLFEKALFPPFADDPRQLVQSWQLLLETGCSLFLPGHGSERKLSLVKQQLERFQRVYGLE